MEDQCIQPVKKKPDPVKELEKDFFIRSLSLFSRRTPPDLDKKSKEELIKYIKEECNYKKELALLFEAVCMAVQQIYHEKIILEGDKFQSFPLLEGTIAIKTLKVYDEEDEEKVFKDLYLFTPNDRVKKLLDDADQTGITNLKRSLESRFYKMIEHLYRIGKETNKNKNKGDQQQ